MGLRLVLGRAGSGKSELCLGEISRELKERPDGYPLIYIVPEQATFQAEYALAAFYGLGGTIRGQVLSFRRLAWKVMQEAGSGKALFIDDAGKGMVLRKALEKLRGELRVFRHAGEQVGVLDNLVQLYNQLKRSCIDVCRLKETFHKHAETGEGLSSLFKEKMKDLILILEEAEGELTGRYLDNEDYLNLLALQMPGSSFLKGAEVWVDGFYSFNSQEYLVLEGLLKICRRVTVTVCLHRDCSPGEKVDELDPFYPAAITCQKLQQRAKAGGLYLEKVILAEENLPRFRGRPGLSYLERNLHCYPVKPFEGEVSSLRLAAAPHRRGEVEYLARELIGLIRDGGWRWRDMAVIVSSPDDYRDIISTVFGDYQIPFFLDQKRPVIHHPLVEFIRSSLEVVNRNWRYEAVFRCIKTEFLLPFAEDENERQKWRERADRLENYVLAFGIQGALWLGEEPWKFRLRDTLEEEDEGEGTLSGGEEAYLRLINETRRMVSAPLIRFREKFKVAGTVREKTMAVYELLSDARAWDRLELWRGEALYRGNPEKAREHLQVYKGVINLMDQLVEIMGEQKMPATLYARIVEAGLESLRLSLVPPSLDQVFVGDVERSRPGAASFVFLLGVNDGVLPSRPREDGIFSEEEQEAVSSWGLELAPGERRRLLDGQFLIYMALTRAARGLWVSYPLADEEGRALVPSLLMAHLKELFPSLQEELLAAEPDDEDNLWGQVAPCSCTGRHGDSFEESPAGYGGDSSVIKYAGAAGSEREGRYAAALWPHVVHPRRTLSHLAVKLSRWKTGAKIHSLWWEVYNWYAAEELWRGQAKRLLGGIFYENREKPLSSKTSLQLYGKEFKASVSRLERYRACPFSHFISHGLRLRERQLYRLESPDIGRFFHAALRNFALSLQEKKLEWGDLESQKCLQLAAEEVERLVPRLQKEILLSSSRYRYLAGKLNKTVGQAVLMLGEHARRSSFKPVGLELAFGPGGDLPGAGFELENGCQVELAGRIDRVDVAHDKEGQAYLCVIDYKSGRTQLKLPEIYFGLSLQVLTYLDIVLTNALTWLGEEALPAGVLYFRVHTPLISSGVVLPPDKIEQELRRRYKMKGLVLEDREIVRMMDNRLEMGYSEVIPVGLTREGSFYRNSAALSRERFALLREHVRHLIKAAAGEIAGGLVEIAPYRLGRSKACTYCSYQAVCQFDTALEGNGFRLLKGGEAEGIWQGPEKRTGKGRGKEDDRQ